MCSASVSLICRREVGHVNGWLLTERASLCWSWVVCRRVLVCVHLCMDYFGSSLPRQLLATGGGNTRHQQALIKLTSALKSTHSKAVSHIFKSIQLLQQRKWRKISLALCTSQSHLLWFISASPPLFFPGPQLWRRRGDSERRLFRRRQERCGTSVTLSLASSSASPPPPPPPPPLSSPAVIAAPIWMPSTGLQMHSRPWLPSRLELDGQTLAVSSVEEQETETSLVLSPPVIGSSFCRQECIYTVCYYFILLLPSIMNPRTRKLILK